MKWFDDEIEKEFERMRQRMEKMLGSPSRPGAATLLTDLALDRRQRVPPR